MAPGKTRWPPAWPQVSALARWASGFAPLMGSWKCRLPPVLWGVSRGPPSGKLSRGGACPALLQRPVRPSAARRAELTLEAGCLGLWGGRLRQGLQGGEGVRLFLPSKGLIGGNLEGKLAATPPSRASPRAATHSCGLVQKAPLSELSFCICQVDFVRVLGIRWDIPIKHSHFPPSVTHGPTSEPLPWLSLLPETLFLLRSPDSLSYSFTSLLKCHRLRDFFPHHPLFHFVFKYVFI